MTPDDLERPNALKTIHQNPIVKRWFRVPENLGYVRLSEKRYPPVMPEVTIEHPPKQRFE